MNESLADKAKQALDNVAGFGTADKAEGATRESVGHGQQAVGEATGNRSLQAEGTANEVKGETPQVVGEAKQGAQNLAENIKHGVADAVSSVKDALHNANKPH